MPKQYRPLALLLVVGLVLRLLFIGADGYTNDISTFESWTLTLRDHGFSHFYAQAGFADYPPGYLYVLGFLAQIYAHIGSYDPQYHILHILVKLPGVFGDLIDAALVFGLVRRIVPRSALVIAACVIFNPALIMISAVWGQVDAVAAAWTLLAIWLLDGVQRNVLPQRTATVAAWVSLACSILIKPTPLVLVPIFLAIPFTKTSRQAQTRSFTDTALGISMAIAVTFILALPFSPAHDIFGCFHWLLERYQFGSSVYAYNSVNAFNLYAIASPFWVSDSSRSLMTFGLPQVIWGTGLVVISVGAFTFRFVRKATPSALLEAAMLASLAFFAFATRMHERYIFNALILMIPLMAVSKAYRFGVLALSTSLVLNLMYSLAYLHAMAHPQPGLNVQDLMPFISRGCGFLVVLVLLQLAFRYLGVFEGPTSQAVKPAWLVSFSRQRVTLGEGLAAWKRRDWWLAGGLALFSFLVCYHGYAQPQEKIFDEIYYARSGAEYLQHVEQYEWTHPPFTKLVITASMLLFGGLAHGDTSAGWRFLNLVVGALMVAVLYRFVHKISGSTLAAGLAAGMLAIDGFHFVQSRIATPEITVACLALLSLTCFYEYWISAQVRAVATPTQSQLKLAVISHGFAAFIGGFISFGLIHFLIHSRDSDPQKTIAGFLLFFYVELAMYLAVRWWRTSGGRTRFAMSYPDGSWVLDAKVQQPFPRDAFGVKSVVVGTSLKLQPFDETHGNQMLGDEIVCNANGGLSLSGTSSTLSTRITPQTAPRALLATAVAVGLLAASKWNGLFDLLLLWVIMIGVSFAPQMPIIRRIFGFESQPRGASWGNPRGFPLDVTIGLTLFVSMTIYVLCYMPYFSLGHDFTDLVNLQHSMYAYHHDLQATHPYQSQWWEWPLLERPISYYYHDFRAGADLQHGSACCVAEILALPNPLIWWAGLLTVPLIGWLAWRERRKGYALIALAYFFQWLPWIASPRIAFEYHFFPNLALICASNAILLERLWSTPHSRQNVLSYWPKALVGIFLIAVLAATIFWYPMVSGTPVTYDRWHGQVLDWFHGLRWI